MSYLQTALKVVKKDTSGNPQPTIRLIEKQTPRDKTIEDILDEIICTTMDRIIEMYKGRQYHATDEIRQAEDETDRIYKAVLQGQASIAEFQEKVNIWERRAIENVK